MRKLLTVCSLCAVALPTFAQTELLANTQPVQPLKSQIASAKSFNIKRFVLANNSDVAVENLLTEVAAKAKSAPDSQTLHIISMDKKVKELAKSISNRLKAMKIKHNISVEHRATINPLYPIYVEFHEIARKPIHCKVEIGEDYWSFDPADYCATKHNDYLQLK
ncbi:hypothetical protein [[Haemophilus] ducreyi]|uniref:hypothetical protein n=1 Tax=Haemophilus ducreyi TaxID=730 RepID=UPI000655C157|nr:hypothetical protein [[Haemophilus] ducreyi]AKO45540.1 hypothetical protein RZ66_04700 [[Haemophilus] ducreyi]AKO46926.1 hypothetical protein RZ67_04600 [[Haemophilus] ducreyi]AKO48267.1 hypothetical protein RZ68_04585 [[Haemophilus] ducreyi]AKO49657.1 hypothetical protein RZ69_04630 [[Haemophilus] ducreyi]OOS04847.1 hypothetical protein B0190_00885 [[Haemophilus] ducreyi]